MMGHRRILDLCAQCAQCTYTLAAAARPAGSWGVGVCEAGRAKWLVVRGSLLSGRGRRAREFEFKQGQATRTHGHSVA